MKQYDIFRAYIWLVDAIRRAPNGITLAELNEQWVATEMSGGQPMLRNTFQRHKAAIEQMFGLYIECDAHNDYRYYIGNEHVLHGDTLQNWLLQTLTVSNVVGESMNMQERILIESVNCDSELLQQLVEAMRQFRAVHIEYQPYQVSEVHSYTMEPYCLKLSRQRWYLLARRTDGQMRVLALDRIKRIKPTGRRFTIDPYFDGADYFSECFGVMTGNGLQPQRIVVRAYGREQYAMRDLPVHHTQRLLVEADDHTDFELTLRPTDDLKAHLLSRGRWLKVVSPQSLADEIRQLHLEAAECPR